MSVPPAANQGAQKNTSPLLRIFGIGCACLAVIIALIVVVVGVPVVGVIINQPRATSSPDPAPATSSTVSEQPSDPDPAVAGPNAPAVPVPTPGRATQTSSDPLDDVLNNRLPDAIGDWQLAHVGTRPVYVRAEQRINILDITNTDSVGKATADNPALGLQGEKVFDRGVCAPHPDGRGGFMCWVWPKDLPDTVLTVQSRHASMDDMIKVAEAVRG
ncbi:hypothetical protein [Dermabacter sp. HSID17554]|uniref:hypothetical protein n=1 Tax=Dermabacter sp. HSID17554 TaxID=2419511 RepID=UPI000F861FF9|nr:hypothetical protein [Dermabacter sp. HSID17554]RUP87323.1 hypothetical protein D8M36_01670 [Dermabacter sp. HSID17554]